MRSSCWNGNWYCRYVKLSSILIIGDAGVRATAEQDKVFVGMVLILIFAEALALYGLIIGIILTSKTVSVDCSV